MPSTFKRLEIKDVILIEPRLFPDDRGYFLESYKCSEFAENGITESFMQDNHSLSTKGVIRGLHFQKSPKSQSKIVRVVKGAIWDVAVDMRRDSPTFGRYVAEELSEENHRMLYIPEGFAHGFVTLTEEAHLLYKCSREYAPECDAGVRFDDPTINIKWPFSDFIVSEKDKKLPFLKDAYLFEVNK